MTFDPTFDQESPLIAGTYVSHPGFNRAHSDPMDMAVVLLAQPAGIAPAQLPGAGALDRMKAEHSIDDQHYTAVGYGRVRETRTGAFGSIFPNTERRVATQTYSALTDSWLRLSMNQSTGDAGTFFGDSGGPHFLGDSTVVVSITVSGDAVCKATDVTYRLDTPVARDFLDDFVPLP
ncbi:MAG TPA: trypsin-like serine protease [Acidimicrobiales bacterium]|nr:trypsin-like serine protease [Acidimicrobiales bacterium]